MSDTFKDRVGKHGTPSYQHFNRSLKHGNAQTSLNQGGRTYGRKFNYNYGCKPLRHHKEDLHLLENKELYGSSQKN